MTSLVNGKGVANSFLVSLLFKYLFTSRGVEKPKGVCAILKHVDSHSNGFRKKTQKFYE